jgi:hypothetical protein
VSSPDDPADPPTPTTTELEPLPDQPAPPATAGADELREAVGVTPKDKKEKAKKEKATKEKAPPSDELLDDDDEDGPKPKRGKGLLILAGTVAVGGVITALVLLGRANESRLIFRCEKDRIVARQGDGFPLPWGDHALSGAQWKPIEIPPDTQCDSRETESMDELEELFLTKLMQEAERKLLAREVTELETAEAQLEQALLLARTEEREYLRSDINRLLGFIEYHRALGKIEDAAETLDEAAKKLDRAIGSKHQRDAAARAIWVREMAAAVRAGPTGEKPDADDGGESPTPSRPDVTTGTALPVEPTPVEPTPEAAPPDAGLPPVGVLL